jgi:hypothetical protein
MLTAVLLASVSVAPTFAAESTAKPAPAPPPKDAAAAKPATEQKLICTREAEVGSIIIKKVCRTPEQVEADRRAAREIADDRSRNGGRADGPVGR